MQDLTITPKTLKWFHYRQNNSGGYFISNDKVSEDVLVQAYSAEQANKLIEDVLDEHSEYCECCGERWNYLDDDDNGDETPSIHGISIYDKYDPYRKDGYATLYYLNGLVERYYPSGSGIIDGECTTSSEAQQKLLG